MILNISYNDEEFTKRIASLVGKPYTFSDRIKMNGIGSSRFTINEYSTAFTKLLDRNNFINYCNIELRPGGIIISFKSLLDTIVWVIPFYKLTIFKNKEQYSFYSDVDYLKISNNHRMSVNEDFIKKLLSTRIKYINDASILN